MEQEVLGKKYTELLLEKYKPNKIIIYSRDELKQYEMSQEYDAKCMRYFIGDVRDAQRLKKSYERCRLRDSCSST